MHIHAIRSSAFPPVALPRVPASIVAALALTAAVMLWGTSFVSANVVLVDLAPLQGSPRQSQPGRSPRPGW